jgi:hypothetical protein
MNPIGTTTASSTTGPDRHDDKVVGQCVQCAYCGHSVPVLVHASVEVKTARFSGYVSGELKERATCSTCHKVFWTAWTIRKPVAGFWAWLGRNV